MAKKAGATKSQDQAIGFSEAEKKALEKLDHTHLLIEIGQYKTRIDELQQVVYDLNQQIRVTSEEHLLLTLKMERDLNDKQEEIVQLQDEFDGHKKMADEKFMSMVDEKEKRFKQALENHFQELKDKDRKIDELYAQIQKNAHFEEREQEYLKKIQDLENRFRQQEYVHNDQMKKMEKNFFKQNQNLESVNKAKIEDIMRNADKIAEKKVRDSEDRTKKENKKLRQELEVHQKELEQLKREKSQMLEENKNFKKNQQITVDGAVEYQNVNHLQAVKIKKLKDKVEYLKNFISEEVSKYTKEIEFMKYQHQTKVQEYEYQVKSLKEQLQIRGRELKNVKALAQMILDQRSDIENFFLQALDQVKSEIKKKNLEKKSKLPEINQKSSIMLQGNNGSTIDENRTKYYNDKVDISDLDLEEKEKLLRILFSKMNQGAPPQNWKSMAEKSDHSTFRDNNLVQQSE